MGRATYKREKFKKMRKAVYRCSIPDYNGKFLEYFINVEILEENPKSYKIKYLEPGTNGQNVGHIKWARRRNVKESIKAMLQKPQSKFNSKIN